MKHKSKLTTAIITCLLLATGLTSCEFAKIPKQPFIIDNAKMSDSDKTLFIYKYHSVEYPERFSEFLSNEKYNIGDTVCLKPCR